MKTFLTSLILALTLLTGYAQNEVKAEETKLAIFAGGCFWCVESDFDHVTGVVSTISGYIGGHVENPTYRDVVSETSGHREAVKIEFDPATWQAFWRTAVLGEAVDSVAADLGKQRGSIYAARSRVMARFRAEVSRLESDFSAE